MGSSLARRWGSKPTALQIGSKFIDPCEASSEPIDLNALAQKTSDAHLAERSLHFGFLRAEHVLLQFEILLAPTGALPRRCKVGQFLIRNERE